MIFVDAGRFAGDEGTPGKMQTDALVEGMNTLDYRVTNVTPGELAHGFEAFRSWRERARFEFVSANVVWQDSGEPIVEPTAVREVKLRTGAARRSMRLGFIGLTSNDPAFLAEGPDGRRIVTIDPMGAAARHVPNLIKNADAVIALVNLDLREARALPKRVTGLDLILGGHGPDRTRSDDFPEDTRFGRTRLLYIGHQGMHLGEVRLRFDKDGTIVSNVRHTIQLTADWPDDPALAGLMERTKVAVNDYNRGRAIAAGPFHSPVLGEGAVADEVDVDGAGGADVGGAGFTGSARCATCHEEAYAIWESSRHAHAFDALVTARQDFNPACVGCHTIGFGRPGGFVSALATPGLKHVGCESCHGPSRDHPETTGPGFGRATTTACVTCHTQDNSPDYDPATYIPRIRHWAERTATR